MRKKTTAALAFALVLQLLAGVFILVFAEKQPELFDKFGKDYQIKATEVSFWGDRIHVSGVFTELAPGEGRRSYNDTGEDLSRNIAIHSNGEQYFLNAGMTLSGSALKISEEIEKKQEESIAAQIYEIFDEETLAREYFGDDEIMIHFRLFGSYAELTGITVNGTDVSEYLAEKVK